MRGNFPSVPKNWDIAPRGELLIEDTPEKYILDSNRIDLTARLYTYADVGLLIMSTDTFTNANFRCHRLRDFCQAGGQMCPGNIQLVMSIAFFSATAPTCMMSCKKLCFNDSALQDSNSE